MKKLITNKEKFLKNGRKLIKVTKIKVESHRILGNKFDKNGVKMQKIDQKLLRNGKYQTNCLKLSKIEQKFGLKKAKNAENVSKNSKKYVKNCWILARIIKKMVLKSSKIW